MPSRPAPRRLVVALQALLLLPAVAGAQGATAPAHRALPAADRQRIDALFADQNKPHVPGCALGVMQQGQLVYGRGYGWADLERSIPITTATLFDVGSTSKQFAAASISLLVQEHKLSYGDDVRKYIPELPDYGTPITIDNLMHHTSGLRDYTGLLVLAGHTLEEATTDSQALERIVHQKHLNFPPGSKYEYSNTGYFLLSVIVKRVSGEPLADFARSRIFLPLGMTHTRYRNHADMLIPNRALGYAPGDSGGFRNSMSNWEQTGDGAVHLSVDDALLWDGNFYHPRVGGQTMVRDLQTRGTLANGDTIHYARGLELDSYRGLNRVQHSGDWIGYHAAFSRFPDQHTSVILLCNSDGISPSELVDRVSDVVLALSFPMPQQPRDTSANAVAQFAGGAPIPAERLAGSYFAAATDEVARVASHGDSLVLDFAGRSLPLQRAGPALYRVTSLPVTVEFHANGNAPADSLRLRVGSDVRANAARFTAATPSAEQLRDVAGSYYSAELGVTWTIALEDGALVLHNDATPIQDITGALVPAMPDGFTAGGGFIRFTRDASGHVDGFGLSASRMRGMRFDRTAR